MELKFISIKLDFDIEKTQKVGGWLWVSRVSQTTHYYPTRDFEKGSLMENVCFFDKTGNLTCATVSVQLKLNGCALMS